MTDPRCTCGPSILDPECPVREHQEELERTADPFAYQERMVAVEELRRILEPGREALDDLLAKAASSPVFQAMSLGSTAAGRAYGDKMVAQEEDMAKFEAALRYVMGNGGEPTDGGRE